MGLCREDSGALKKKYFRDGRVALAGALIAAAQGVARMAKGGVENRGLDIEFWGNNHIQGSARGEEVAREEEAWLEAVAMNQPVISRRKR